MAREDEASHFTSFFAAVSKANIVSMLAPQQRRRLSGPASSHISGFLISRGFVAQLDRDPLGRAQRDKGRPPPSPPVPLRPPEDTPRLRRRQQECCSDGRYLWQGRLQLLAWKDKQSFFSGERRGWRGGQRAGFLKLLVAGHRC